MTKSPSEGPLSFLFCTSLWFGWKFDPESIEAPSFATTGVRRADASQFVTVPMTVQKHLTQLDDVMLLEPEWFEDGRGFFFESWNYGTFDELTGVKTSFVQDNHSGSRQGVLRGLHYQLPPHPQGKLVRAVVGSVFDVAVDVRRASATFGEWVGVELSAENRKQLWVPAGFAHGFLALSDWAELLYKTTDYYAPEADRSIRWDDPDIGIEWPFNGTPILSDKDAAAPLLRNAEVFA